jgi:hypothetical protein
MKSLKALVAVLVLLVGCSSTGHNGGGGSGGIHNGGGGGSAVDLGSAGDFVILAKSGISNVPTSTITGNIGVSPAAASFITGFALTADATNVFSTSHQITGQVFASNFAPPTPNNLTVAVNDMQTAFTAAANQAAGTSELGAGNIGSMTLTAGVYKWGTGLLIPTDVYLSGSDSDVFVFQVAKNFKVANGVSIVLTGGAVASNVVWQVAGNVDIGTTSSFQGVVLCKTSIMMRTGASLNGRLYSQTAITLDHNTVVQSD